MVQISPERVIVFTWTIILAIYTAPLLLTKASGDWDFWYLWDDRTNFIENHVLQQPLRFQTFYQVFTLIQLHVYEPLGWLLKLAVVKSVGFDAYWIRVVSAFIHFIAGFVLAKVSALILDIDYMLTQFKQLERSECAQQQRKNASVVHFRACCLSAVVFLIHPLHVEVIAWPSAQPYVLSAVFSTWALLVYMKKIHQKLNTLMESNTKKGPKDHELFMWERLFATGKLTTNWLSSALYLGALLSKSASLFLLSGFFLVDVWVYSHLSRQRSFSMKLVGNFIAQNVMSVASFLAFVAITAISNAEGGLPDVVSLSLGERMLKALTSPVWVLRCLLWPSKLRPHYQIQPGDVSLTNPEYTLSLAIAAFVLILVVSNLWHRGVSKHMLALAYFICMLMPVSGLIQHGIITAGANRYAYLPTMVLVPYGGWIIAHWILGQSCVVNETQQATALSRRAIVRKVQTHKSMAPHTNQTCAWMLCLLLIGTMLSISTSLLTHWRNEDSLYRYSLCMDPADWKVLGQRAEYLLSAERCGADDIECRQHWALAHEFSPRNTLKAQLYRLHLRVALGDVERACDDYLALREEHSGNSSVHNNAAICLAFRGRLVDARREFTLALQCKAIEETRAIHVANAHEFDTWETEHAHHELDEMPAFVATMTY